MGFWSAIISAAGSALTSSGNRQQSAQETRAQNEQIQRMQEMELADNRNLEMWRRGNQLQDRRYTEQAISRYRPFNTSTRYNAEAPPGTDINPTPIAEPQAVANPDTRNRTGLMFFNQGNQGRGP